MSLHNSGRFALGLLLSLTLLSACDCGGPAAGVDAASADSALIDAEIGDLLDASPASDADSEDVAVPDTAVPDAVVPDAVVPDAAVPDAAVPDAAVPDAAVPDAAVPDAAVPDAVGLPTGRFVFPPAHVLTDSDKMRVRGVSDDADGVRSVVVGDVQAVSDDGYATWTAEVPLVEGPQQFQLTITDSQGHAAVADTLRVVREVFFYDPFVLAVDEAAGLAYVWDSVGHSLLSVDMTTGARELIAKTGDGQGEDIFNVTGLVVSGTFLHYAVGKRDSPFIGRINLANRQRSLVSDNGISSPVDLVQPAGLGWSQGVLVVADRGLAGLIAVNPSDGTRTVLSDASTGSGEAFGTIWSMAVDAPHQRAFVYEQSAARQIVQVDLNTGDRTVVTSSVDSNGAPLTGVGGLSVAADGVWLALCMDRGAVVKLNLDTSQRTVISSNTVGSGLPPGQSGQCRLHSADAKLLRVDRIYDDLADIEISTGDRVHLGRGRLGAGRPLYFRGTGFVHSSGGSYLVVGDAAAPAFRQGLDFINYVSSQRSVVSDTNQGSGPLFSNVRDLALDEVGATIFVVDTTQEALFEIDLTTGDRSIRSVKNDGLGDPISDMSLVAYSGSGSVVHILDAMDKTIFAVDRSTGQRSVLSGNGVGTGPELSAPVDLSWDPYASRLLVADTSVGIVAISPQDGTRELLIPAGYAAGQIWQVLRVEVGRSAGELFASNNTDFYRITFAPVAVTRVAVGQRLSVPTCTQISHFSVDDDGILWARCDQTQSIHVIDAETGSSAIVYR